MKKFNILFISLLAISITLVNCKKDSTTTEEILKVNNGVTKEMTAEVTGPDVLCCGVNNIGAKAALRAITFGATLPDTINYNFVLAAASDVAIFAQDCCVRDDVVEIWVDGCLKATVNSEPGAFGTHPGETHTVTLGPGAHVIQYINTVSSVGPSGWNVSETELPASPIVLGTCNSGVPNFNVGCSNMLALIRACKVNSPPHGQFVSCVAHLANGWVGSGLITLAQKDALMSCVAKWK